jgi:hypothetical protein
MAPDSPFVPVAEAVSEFWAVSGAAAPESDSAATARQVMIRVRREGIPVVVLVEDVR